MLIVKLLTVTFNGYFHVIIINVTQMLFTHVMEHKIYCVQASIHERTFLHSIHTSIYFFKLLSLTLYFIQYVVLYLNELVFIRDR